MHNSDAYFYEESRDETQGKNYKYKKFVKFIFSKNLTNLDSMLLLTAQKGGGKSSTAIQLARAWCDIIGVKFDPKRFIAYNNSDLVKKIDTLPPFMPLIADESVRFITSEDWSKRENKDLKKKLAQVREKHLFFILCFPLKIKKVDKTYLESFVNYWIEVYARGRTAVFVRDNNPVFDSWRLDKFRDLGAYNEFTEDYEIERMLKKHPNFWSLMKVPKVPKNIYAKYSLMREANVYNNEEVSNTLTKDDVFKSSVIMTLHDIMTNDKTLTMQRILMHINNNYDIKMSKHDINSVVKDSKLILNSVKNNMLDLV